MPVCTLLSVPRTAPGTAQVLHQYLLDRCPGRSLLEGRDHTSGPRAQKEEMHDPPTRPLKKPPRDCRRFSGLFWDLSPFCSEFTSTVAGSTPCIGSLASCLLFFCLVPSAAPFLSLEEPSLPFGPVPAGSGSGGAMTFSAESDVYSEFKQNAYLVAAGQGSGE